MDRKSIILKHVKLDGRGIEIAPAYSPIAPKSEGFNVQIIDVCNRQQLLEKFKDYPVDLTRIEEVDFVWSGQSYAELVGQTKCFDFIIASHVIEHTTDIISFLNDCDELLKEDGVLSLAIPDKRTCFDYFRPLSGIDKAIDAFLHKNKIHTVGTLVDYELNHCCKVSGLMSWFLNDDGDFMLPFRMEVVKARLNKDRTSSNYEDAHNWVFVPHSFRLLIHDLYELGLINLREVSFHDTLGNEFFVTLSRQGQGSGLSRLEMLKTIEREQSVKFIDQLEAVREQLERTERELAAVREQLENAQRELAMKELCVQSVG